MGDPDLVPAKHLGGDPRELYVRELGEVEFDGGGEGMAEEASASVLAKLEHLARVGGEELDDAFQPLPDLRVDLVEPTADEAPRELAQQCLEAQTVLEVPPEAVTVRGRPEEDRHPGAAAAGDPARDDRHEPPVLGTGDADVGIDDRLPRPEHLSAERLEGSPA